MGRWPHIAAGIELIDPGSLFDREFEARKYRSGVAAGETFKGADFVMPKRIILIDRDPLRRGELADALSRQGAEVSEFEAGKDAMQHLLFNSVNAIVLDYGSSYETRTPMPGGKQIVKEVTDLDAFVPLILICDRCDRLDHETSAAVDLVLRRPITARQVGDGLQTVLGETLRERAQRKSGYIFAFR